MHRAAGRNPQALPPGRVRQIGGTGTGEGSGGGAPQEVEPARMPVLERGDCEARPGISRQDGRKVILWPELRVDRVSGYDAQKPHGGWSGLRRAPAYLHTQTWSRRPLCHSPGLAFPRLLERDFDGVRHIRAGAHRVSQPTLVADRRAGRLVQNRARRRRVV